MTLRSAVDSLGNIQIVTVLVWVLFTASSQSSLAMEAGRQELPVGSNIKDTAWVWSQNPGHYSIQLASASDEASIEAVMARLSLPAELAVVQSQRNGQPWYVMIYGHFVSKEAALEAVARLPAALKKAGPWVRQFSALQSEIGQATSR
jgi:DamX protein